jgi:ribosomal protein L37E
VIGRVHAVGQRANREALSEAVAKVDTTLAALCVRCGRQSNRMVVSKAVCISCYNREREAKEGRNARGNMPVSYAPLCLRRSWPV